MTRTPSAPPTTCSTSAPAPASTAATSSPKAQVDDLIAAPRSWTGKYLSGELSVPIPERKPRSRRALKIVNARGNNLKNITAEIPLGLFTCVTGVSGGGKSTLLIDTLYNAVARKLNGASLAPAAARPHRGPRAHRQDHRHRPVADRPHAALEPGDLHRRLHADPRMVRRAARSPRRAATSPAASPSTSRAAAARPARATASSRSRCTSCPTSTSPATSARASATTARRSR